MNREKIGSVEGRCEIIVEDSNGNVKQHVEQKNMITEAFKRYVMLSMFADGNLAQVLRPTTNFSFVARKCPSKMALVCMNEEVEINNKRVIPEYISTDMNNWGEKMVFYGENTTTTTVETDKQMLHFDEGCYTKTDEKELVVEFRKSIGEGTIKSIAVGRNISTDAATAVNNLYITTLKNSNMPRSWRTGAYKNNWSIFEYLGDEGGTVIYRANNDTIDSYNYKTGEAKTVAVDQNISNSIKNLPFGLKVGNAIYRAILKSYTTTAIVITLQYIPDWTNYTAIQTKDITITRPVGATVGTNESYNTTPVLLYNPETGKLEIFQVDSYNTISSGEVTTTVGEGEDAVEETKTVYGFLTHKITVDISNAAFDTVVKDQILPFCVCGCCQGSYSGNPFSNLTGAIIGGKYYLPTSRVVANRVGMDEKGTIINTAVAGGTAGFNTGIGVVTDADLNVLDGYCFSSSNVFFAPVVMDDGIGYVSIENKETAGAIMCYQSGLVSVLNLDETVVKGENDILRVIYHYRMV